MRVKIETDRSRARIGQIQGSIVGWAQIKQVYARVRGT